MIFALHGLQDAPGKILKSELRFCLTTAFGDYVPLDELEAILTESDVDSNDLIRQDKFVGVLRRHYASQDIQSWGKLRMFEMLGGIAMIEKSTKLMYANVQKDPLLAPAFKGKDIGKIVRHQYLYLSASFGGPAPWSGRSLKDIHENIKITTEMMDKYVELFKQAALDSGMPPAKCEKFGAAIDGFRASLINS
jgi:hemoglobin